MRGVKILVVSILIVSLCINATGCGTIFNGTHQEIPVSIAPSGTEVTVYRWSGEIVSGPMNSPGEMTIERPKHNQPYIVRASKDGYCPKYWITNTHTTGGTLSYIWLLFLLSPAAMIALAVDSSTGGAFAIETKPFEGTLALEASCAQ